MSIPGSYLKKRGNSLDLHTTSDTLHKAAVVYKDSAQFHWRNGHSAPSAVLTSVQRVSENVTSR